MAPASLRIRPVMAHWVICAPGIRFQEESRQLLPRGTIRTDRFAVICGQYQFSSPPNSTEAPAEKIIFFLMVL